MPISIDKKVSVIPGVIAPVKNTNIQNCLLISDNYEIFLDEKFLEFTNKKDVSEKFGIDSKEASFAGVYFRGHETSTKIPEKLIIAPYTFVPKAPASVKSKLFTTEQLSTVLTDLKSFTGQDENFGDIQVLFKTDEEAPVVVKVGNLVFSDMESLDSCLEYLATKVNEAITAEEKLGEEYKIKFSLISDIRDANHILLETSNSGSKYNIIKVDSEGSASTDILVVRVLGLLIEDGAIVTPGSDDGRISFEELLNKFKEIRDDWWTIATVTEKTDDKRMEIAKWVNEQNKGCRYVYICQDSSKIASTTTSNEDTFGFKIHSQGMSGTTVVYGDETHAGFIASVSATINFEINNGVLTFSGRRQSGLRTTANNDSEANCLESNFYNYYGSYSSTNPKYNFLETGIVGGDHIWLDSLFNHIWLDYSVQMDLLNLLIDKNRIPFNSSGFSLIANCCDNTINKAIANGTISAGVKLNPLQYTIVNEMVGKDISNELYAYGYYFYFGVASSEDRIDRKYGSGALFYCDGGSIQKISLLVNVLL